MPSLKRATSPTPLPDSPHPSTTPIVVAGKKRKLGTPQDTPGGAKFDSPAPRDGSRAETPVDGPIPLTSEFDLTGAAKSAIARLPTFIPTSDDSNYFTTTDLPMNRQNFRYIPACSSPGSNTVDRTAETPPQCVRLDWEDRSPYVRVTQDGLRMTTEKGWRSSRCNVPVREGKWYMEVHIERGGGDGKGDTSARSGAHVRLGWGRREAPLNGPAGLDGYSYAIRDLTGEKVTLSRPRPYGRSFGSGDVIGMYISLPPRKPPSPKDPHDPARILRKRIPILYKSQVYFESLEYPESKEMMALMDYSGKVVPPSPTTKKEGPIKGPGPPGRPKQTEGPILRPLPTLPGSGVAYFINGECQGPAFQDIYDFLQLRETPAELKSKEKKGGSGMDAIMKERENNFDDGSLGYYPFVSVFNNARVRINPGPDFAFPPPNDIDGLCGFPSKGRDGQPSWRPLCERYEEYMAEVWRQDELDAVLAKKELEEAEMEGAAERVEEEKRQQRLKKNRERAAAKRQEKVAASTKKIAKDVRADLVSVEPPESHVVSLPEHSIAHDPSPLEVTNDAFSPVETTLWARAKSDDLDALVLEATEVEHPRSDIPAYPVSSLRDAPFDRPESPGIPTRHMKRKTYDYSDSEEGADCSLHHEAPAGDTPPLPDVNVGNEPVRRDSVAWSTDGPLLVDVKDEYEEAIRSDGSPDVGKVLDDSGDTHQ